MMLTEKGTLKVLDFGIARLLGSARMTRAGNIIGTLEYMAPEQVKGAETDGRSDIYALGMMLYEVLTGQLPFQTENEFELMKLQTETMPTPPREINPAIPEEVEEAIMRAIQKDPDERFQTAGEMRELLLEAGFGTQGTMHGVTGTFKARAATHPSRPAISKTDVVANESEKTAVKATRLGEAAQTPAREKSVKATRLGAAGATAAASTTAPKATRLGNVNALSSQKTGEENEPPKSFLSNLSAVHYIGAGVGALILIGVIALVPIMLLGGSKTAETKPVEKPKEEIQQKPDIVTMPQQAPQTTQPAADSNPTLSSQPQTDVKPLVPVEGSTDKTDAPKQDKPAVIAQKPVAPKQDKPAATKPKTTGKKSAEELLTGN
jgi:serine/threonine protein kinase